jgi:hypothetical protein
MQHAGDLDQVEAAPERPERKDIGLPVFDLGACERARLAHGKSESGLRSAARTLAPANRWAVSIACCPVPAAGDQDIVPSGAKLAAGNRWQLLIAAARRVRAGGIIGSIKAHSASVRSLA